MAGRRIIATIEGGKSRVVEDGAAPSNAFDAVPGFDAAVVWATPASPRLPWDGSDPVHKDNVLPDAGGTTLWVVTFPPDSVMMAEGFDPEAAGAEYAARLPGLAERFEADHPGMHMTDTIDYDIVLDGDIVVEFDDGQTVAMTRGDILVQHGTRHAWRNPGTKPATMIFVLIGASRY
jgi:mannose-6-phosphate isomerase-like protein (cupin superfamily)